MHSLVAKPEIMKKFEKHLAPHFSEAHVKKLMDLGNNPAELYKMPVDEYVDLYVKERIL